MTDSADAPEPVDVDGDAEDTGLDGPGRGRMGLAVTAVVALLAVAFVVVLATRDPAGERRSRSPLIGRVAPALVGETIDGGTFDLDDHRGQWVVVNFFASWCKPCIEEHPELVRFDQAHRAAGDAAVVSVVFNDEVADVRDFFAQRGGEWPVVADSGDTVVRYGVVGVPETYLVTPAGDVVQKYTGGVTQAMIERDMAAVAAQSASGGS